MGQLSFKLYKNENNIDTSLYQVYRSKLDENIWKYYKFDLFIEITIDFNHCLQMTLESPANLFNNLLV